MLQRAYKLNLDGELHGKNYASVHVIAFYLAYISLNFMSIKDINRKIKVSLSQHHYFIYYGEKML